MLNQVILQQLFSRFLHDIAGIASVIDMMAEMDQSGKEINKSSDKLVCAIRLYRDVYLDKADIKQQVESIERFFATHYDVKVRYDNNVTLHVESLVSIAAKIHNICESSSNVKIVNIKWLDHRMVVKHDVENLQLNKNSVFYQLS